MPLRMSNLLRPFEDFFKNQVSGGILLLGAALFALFMANSPWQQAYHHFWETPLGINLGPWHFEYSLHHWINDGLMAIFFFVVGLEIKRELLAGELTGIRHAALPIAAALGGMLMPAAIYLLFNPGGEGLRGWGIPMATDIAFALGVVALLGNRIQRSLAIFLTALAIVDDLGAVLVIAFFYTGELNFIALLLGAGCLVGLILGNRAGLQQPLFYTLLGLCLWLCLLKSGIHASIAGVLVGATIPVAPRHRHPEFLRRAETLMQHYRSFETIAGPFHVEARLGTLLALEHVCHDAMSPLQRMEHAMHGWVIFGVMPLFALANAGVHLEANDLLHALTAPVSLGVATGLVLGKPIGILLFTWIAVHLRLAELPAGSRWRDLLGIALLAGIGFTMSLFITGLAFQNGMTASYAKVGIFSGSLLAGVCGYLLLALGHRTPPPAPHP